MCEVTRVYQRHDMYFQKQYFFKVDKNNKKKNKVFYRPMIASNWLEFDPNNLDFKLN